MKANNRKYRTQTKTAKCLLICARNYGGPPVPSATCEKASRPGPRGSFGSHQRSRFQTCRARGPEFWFGGLVPTTTQTPWIHAVHVLLLSRGWDILSRSCHAGDDIPCASFLCPSVLSSNNSKTILDIIIMIKIFCNACYFTLEWDQNLYKILP